MDRGECDAKAEMERTWKQTAGQGYDASGRLPHAIVWRQAAMRDSAMLRDEHMTSSKEVVMSPPRRVLCQVG